MKNDSILFIGLDTHKVNTEVAYVIDGRENSPNHLGKILTNKQAFIKLARQLQSRSNSSLSTRHSALRL
ncbi:hypothetical protein GCM10022277_13110 [Litoribacillus peritrichatus]|uniref:IS110 family transposase n=1 Tax=Litoribacillus peritrichatus TaxID=718191 RepID=A0ABP7MAJ4_9GAMM